MATHDLPLPDYDHLPLGSLGHRVRALDAEGVRALVAYEEAHGARLPVLQVLRTRLGELEAGALPSGGDPAGPTPEVAGAPDSGSPVSRATASEPARPAPHGVPTTPGKPQS